MNQTNNTNAKSPQALQGVRVLDLTRILAGPWCTQTLADLGADVIKIERPAKDASEGQGGDDTRRWGPPFLKDKDGHDSVESAYFMCANRNKRSVTCDISQPAGQALIRKLVMQCDVVVENFKVGDLARYGLDYASLSKLKPSLVYCSITGFGQTGPYKDRAGYDYAVQAMGGLMSVTGERDDVPGGGPQKVGVAVADLFTGLNSVIGILAALRHAERTGQGQQVDIALLDTQVSMLANLGAQYLSNGEVPKRLGNAHANIVPYQVFEVAPSIDCAHRHTAKRVHHLGRGQRQPVRQILPSRRPARHRRQPQVHQKPRPRHQPRGARSPLGHHPQNPQQRRLVKQPTSRPRPLRSHQQL